MEKVIFARETVRQGFSLYSALGKTVFNRR